MPVEPCAFGGHFHAAEPAPHNSPAWAYENTMAYPVNRGRMTPGMQYRGRGGRWPG
jgi:hypothetical protein